MWCLEHGASIHPRDQEPLRDDILTVDQRRCPKILEEAAGWATVVTFELLRAREASLGWRPLHPAVETALYPWIDRPEKMQQREGESETAEESEKAEKGEKAREGVNPAETYAERMAMVRHLVDVVELDVNGLDQPPGTRYGGRIGGNAPRYVATGEKRSVADREININPRELTWFLLNRGLDPSAALLLYITRADNLRCSIDS